MGPCNPSGRFSDAMLLQQTDCRRQHVPFLLHEALQSVRSFFRRYAFATNWLQAPTCTFPSSCGPTIRQVVFGTLCFRNKLIVGANMFLSSFKRPYNPSGRFSCNKLIAGVNMIIQPLYFSLTLSNFCVQIGMLVELAGRIDGSNGWDESKERIDEQYWRATKSKGSINQWNKM